MAPTNQRGTDWGRLKGLEDGDVEFDEDAPPTRPEDWNEATPHRGVRGFLADRRVVETHKVTATVSLDEEVLRYFKNQGEGWQGKLNAALREYVAAHTK